MPEASEITISGAWARDVENRLVRLETRLDSMVEHMATKSDLEGIKTLIAERESSMQRWLIGILLAASTTAMFALLRLLMT